MQDLTNIIVIFLMYHNSTIQRFITIMQLLISSRKLTYKNKFQFLTKIIDTKK